MKLKNLGLIVTGLIALSSCQSKIPTKGLVLHIPSSQTNSKKANHYIIMGSEPTKDRFANTNAALSFDGIDDQVIWTVDSSSNTLPASFSFWVNFKAFNSSVLGTDIIDNHQTGVWFSIGKSRDTENKIAINLGNGKTPPGSINRKTFTAMDALELEKWYHIVGIVENVNSMKIYINGVQSQGNYSGSTSTYSHSSHNGSIGRAWDPNVFFNGAIADFRIYKRILSSSEVALLFKER